MKKLLFITVLLLSSCTKFKAYDLIIENQTTKGFFVEGSSFDFYVQSMSKELVTLNGGDNVIKFTSNDSTIVYSETIDMQSNKSYFIKY